MEGILSGDAAGELLVEINDIKSNMITLGTCTDEELQAVIDSMYDDE